MRRQMQWSASRLIEELSAHLGGARGLVPKTCENYADYVSRFLNDKYGDGVVDLEALRPEDFKSFITEQSSRYKPATLGVMAAALRGLIRFLKLRGLCDGRWVEAVPLIAKWRLASLPARLTQEELNVLLESFDCSKATQVRDYAMVVCMATLGLRVGEVARLSLDDIDWRSGVIRLRSTKSRRDRALPLLPVVGKAIVAYLRGGRPKTDERGIFVCHKNRVGVALCVQSAKTAIRRAFQRAGLNPSPGGSHILRHTAATRMLQNGATLKEIADVLGHKKLETTLIYTKVDLTALGEVAMPWPEVHR